MFDFTTVYIYIYISAAKHTGCCKAAGVLQSPLSHMVRQFQTCFRPLWNNCSQQIISSLHERMLMCWFLWIIRCAAKHMVILNYIGRLGCTLVIFNYIGVAYDQSYFGSSSLIQKGLVFCFVSLVGASSCTRGPCAWVKRDLEFTWRYTARSHCFMQQPGYALKGMSGSWSTVGAWRKLLGCGIARWRSSTSQCQVWSPFQLSQGFQLCGEQCAVPRSATAASSCVAVSSSLGWAAGRIEEHSFCQGQGQLKHGSAMGRQLARSTSSSCTCWRTTSRPRISVQMNGRLSCGSLRLPWDAPPWLKWQHNGGCGSWGAQFGLIRPLMRSCTLWPNLKYMRGGPSRVGWPWQGCDLVNASLLPADAVERPRGGFVLNVTSRFVQHVWDRLFAHIAVMKILATTQPTLKCHHCGLANVIGTSSRC